VSQAEVKGTHSYLEPEPGENGHGVGPGEEFPKNPRESSKIFLTPFQKASHWPLFGPNFKNRALFMGDPLRPRQKLLESL